MIKAFSGTHGTGKTTSALQCAVNEKFYNPNKSITVLINQEAFCPWPINQVGCEKTQAWIFANQIKSEMDALHTFNIVVTDRTIIDVVAYTIALGFQDLAQGMLGYAQAHVHNYASIHFKQIKFNDHLYSDGIRDIEWDFRQKVENIMSELYANLNSNSLLRAFYHV